MSQCLPSPGLMFCRKCGYQLTGLSENRCPECGRPFDPGWRRTYLRHPKGWRRRLWVRRVMIGLTGVILLLLICLGSLLVELHLRWKGQQEVIEAVNRVSGTTTLVAGPPAQLHAIFGRLPMSTFWSPLPRTYKPGLLGSRLAFLFDQVEEVFLAGRQDTRLFGRVLVVRFENPIPVDDAWLSLWAPALQKCSSLKKLVIYSNQVTDRGLESLRSLPRHIEITLGCPLVTPQALEDIRQTHPLVEMAASVTNPS